MGKTEHSGNKDSEWLSEKKFRRGKYCEGKGWDGEADTKVKYACRRSCANYLDGENFDRCEKFQDDDDRYDDDDDENVSSDSYSGGSVKKCKDRNDFRFETEHVGKRDCEWLSEKTKRQRKYCNTKGWKDDSSRKVKYYCQESCEKYVSKCRSGKYDDDHHSHDKDDYNDDSCSDSRKFKFETEFVEEKNCSWLSEKKDRQEKYCETRGWNGEASSKVEYACKDSCKKYNSCS